MAAHSLSAEPHHASLPASGTETLQAGTTRQPRWWPIGLIESKTNHAAREGEQVRPCVLKLGGHGATSNTSELGKQATP
eukprot:6455605-Amphidinium_carterae.1